MNEITIKSPEWVDTGSSREWKAKYTVAADENVRLISVEARSSVEVVVAKVRTTSIIGDMVQFYVAVPNFGVSIPGIGDLSEAHWITEHLIGAGMPAPDAVTAAQVLRDLGAF